MPVASGYRIFGLARSCRDDSEKMDRSRDRHDGENGNQPQFHFQAPEIEKTGESIQRSSIPKA